MLDHLAKRSLKRSRPVKKPAPLTSTHVDDRHGDNWPLPPRSGARGIWTGWMTHQEYNLVEMYDRYDLNNIYAYGARMNLTTSSAQTIFHKMTDTGLFTKTSNYELFYISAMGMMLYNMTDQYMLQLSDEEEEGVA